MSTIEDTLLGSSFGFEIQGRTLAYFSSVTGLKFQVAVTEFQQQNTQGKIITRKIPGRPSYSEVVLKRGYTVDQSIFKWFEEVALAGKEVERTTASIVIYDRTYTEAARFNLDRCWPSKLTVSDPSASSDDVLVEELTIQHEFLDWVS